MNGNADFTDETNLIMKRAVFRYIKDLVGWLVWGLTALSDSISVYIGLSPKEREREERKDR